MNRPVVQAVFIFLLACAPYLNSLDSGFHYDDFHSVVNNPHIRTLSNIPRFFVDAETFSVRPEKAMYRPLLLVSYALNYAVNEMAPAGYHLVNIAIHGVNAVLVYFFLLCLGGCWRLALGGAVFFAVSPLHSEAVNYVSSRSELLMAAFFLLACLTYLRFVRKGRRGWYGIALASTALALGCKSVAVVIVGIIPLCDWYLGESPRRRWRYYLPFATLVLCYILVVRQYMGKALGAPVRSFDVQLWTQCKALIHYLQMGSMPVRLSVEHQFFVAQSPVELPVLGALVAIGSGVVLIVWKGGRSLRFALTWIGLTLLPTLVVPLIVLANEHRLYLAGVAGAWAAGLCVVHMARRQRGVALVGTAVYTIMTASLTWQRNEVWADELTLWGDAAAKGPLMLKPWLRLADALVQKQRLREAEVAYLKAVVLRPQHVAARTNFGRLYMQLGQYERAADQFSALLAVSPDAVAARLNLAEIALRQSRWEEAAAHYRRVLQYDDTGGIAHGKLGYIASKMNDPATALQYYDRALALVEGRDAVRFRVHRGAVLKQLDRLEEAEGDYRRALELDISAVDAWYNLGNLYRDSGRPSLARKAYDQVIKVGIDKDLTRRASQQIKHLKP